MNNKRKNSKSDIINSQQKKMNLMTELESQSFKSDFQSLNECRKDEINIALGLFFFGCNIPFNVVESKPFKDFIKCLIPTEVYTPPTRKTLSSTILDQVHKKIVTEKFSLHGTKGVLLIDGWKNSSANKQNVVCTVHTAGDKSVFLNSWDLTGVSETGDALSKVINEAIALAKNKYNIEIYAVVSDNASNMISMGKKVSIWHTTCHSHSGNLFAKALVPKKFANRVNKLLRQFKSAGAENELVKRGGSKIILACDTRWCSYRDAFRCLLKNSNIMRKMIEDKIVVLDPKDEDMQKLNFEDPSFDTIIQDHLIIFDPICELINVCQKSDSNLADACEEWLKINIPTVNDEYENILGSRLNKVLTPIVLASNLLHPHYRGQRFKDAEQLTMAYDFIEQQLTLENSENDRPLSVLRKLTEKLPLKFLEAERADVLHKLKIKMNQAMNADTAGMRSRAMTLYTDAVQLINNLLIISMDPGKFNTVEKLKEEIERRIEALQIIVRELGLNDFRNNNNIFSKLQGRGIDVPEAFWIAAKYFYPKLSSLAQKLLKIPAASAQLERLFSSWAFIHSDLRNRLSVERSMKLVDIYYSIKMNELHGEKYDLLKEN